MDDRNRLQEAIKQIRLAEQEMEKPDVSQDLEQALEALQTALESLEDDH